MRAFLYTAYLYAISDFFERARYTNVMTSVLAAAVQFLALAAVNSGYSCTPKYLELIMPTMPAFFMFVLVSRVAVWPNRCNFLGNKAHHLNPRKHPHNKNINWMRFKLGTLIACEKAHQLYWRYVF